jgi:hypothetical protein
MQGGPGGMAVGGEGEERPSWPSMVSTCGLNRMSEEAGYGKLGEKMSN